MFQNLVFDRRDRSLWCFNQKTQNCTAVVTGSGQNCAAVATGSSKNCTAVATGSSQNCTGCGNWFLSNIVWGKKLVLFLHYKEG